LKSVGTVSFLFGRVDAEALNGLASFLLLLKRTPAFPSRLIDLNHRPSLVHTVHFPRK